MLSRIRSNLGTYGIIANVSAIVLFYFAILFIRYRNVDDRHLDSLMVSPVEGRTLHIFLVSCGADRQYNDGKMMISSVLMTRQSPITFHILTDKSAFEMWDEWSNPFVNSCTRMVYYDVEQYIGIVDRFIDFSQFKHHHHSTKFALFKLFVQDIVVDPSVDWILALDTDMIVIGDLLNEVLPYVTEMEALDKINVTDPINVLGIMCPTDIFRVHKYCIKVNRPRNCHSSRYCFGGFFVIRLNRMREVGFSQIVLDETKAMVVEYGDVDYKVADQDIINRFLGTRSYMIYPNLPCSLNCFYKRFHRSYLANSNVQGCENVQCKILHWTNKSKWKDREFFKYFPQSFMDVPSVYLNYDACPKT